MKTHAIFIIVAPDDFIELRHSVNSTLRAVSHVSDPTLFDIYIFDETAKYGKIYEADQTQIPVINTASDLRKIKADYIFIVPALTLISENWPSEALHTLDVNSIAQLVRSELYITWGGTAPYIYKQVSKISPLYSILEPATSGSVAVAHSLFSDRLRQIPTDFSLSKWLSDGIGWLEETAHIVEQTATFTRRSTPPTPYPQTPAFAPSAAKLSNIPTLRVAEHTQIRYNRSPRETTIQTLQKFHLIEPVKKVAKLLPRQTTASIKPGNLPTWLNKEWRALHRIDNRLFPNNHLSISTSPTTPAQQIADLYRRAAEKLNHNHYDYVFFAPWLIRGGADKFTIDYANAIAKLHPKLNVLVITTLNRNDEWANKLGANVDYCDLGSITSDTPDITKFFLIETLLSQVSVRTIHIINSELAYDFVRTHTKWLTDKSIQVVATAFSQEILANDKMLGYSHSHVPTIYDATTLITSDNQELLSMWRSDYGFDNKKLLVHHLAHVSNSYIPQPIHLRDSTQKPFRVLWASRLSTEKMPELVADIGAALSNDNIIIEMYGTKAENFNDSFIKTLPSNVSYKGPFNGIDSLPIDTYDAFLYTSLFDGMPNTLLEIGMRGLPIVASRVGGIPELIQDSVTGILVQDPRNVDLYATAIKRLKEDSELSQNLRSQLQQKITQEYNEKQFDRSVSDMLKRLGY